LSYFRNETFSKTVRFTDKDDAPIDPDSTTVTVYMPDGTTASSSLTSVETGEYELNYNIPADAQAGDWRVLIHAEKGDWKESELLIFTVVEV